MGSVIEEKTVSKSEAIKPSEMKAKIFKTAIIDLEYNDCIDACGCRCVGYCSCDCDRKGM